MTPTAWTYNDERSRRTTPIGDRFACYRRRRGGFRFVGFVGTQDEATRYLRGSVVMLQSPPPK